LQCERSAAINREFEGLQAGVDCANPAAFRKSLPGKVEIAFAVCLASLYMVFAKQRNFSTDDNELLGINDRA